MDNDQVFNDMAIVTALYTQIGEVKDKVDHVQENMRKEYDALDDHLFSIERKITRSKYMQWMCFALVLLVQLTILWVVWPQQKQVVPPPVGWVESLEACLNY